MKCLECIMTVRITPVKWLILSQTIIHYLLPSHLFCNEIPYDAMYSALMMEEVIRENDFIFSLALKLKMLTELGSLPKGHGPAGSSRWMQRNKRKGLLNCTGEARLNANAALLNPVAPIPGQTKLRLDLSHQETHGRGERG